jgi:hypothetical protein
MDAASRTEAEVDRATTLHEFAPAPVGTCREEARHLRGVQEPLRCFVTLGQRPPNRVRAIAVRSGLRHYAKPLGS